MALYLLICALTILFRSCPNSTGKLLLIYLELIYSINTIYIIYIIFLVTNQIQNIIRCLPNSQDMVTKIKPYLNQGFMILPVTKKIYKVILYLTDYCKPLIIRMWQVDSGVQLLYECKIGEDCLRIFKLKKISMSTGTLRFFNFNVCR